eukprot:gene6907-6578_t
MTRRDNRVARTHAPPRKVGGTKAGKGTLLIASRICKYSTGMVVKVDLQPLVDQIAKVLGSSTAEYWNNMKLFLSAKICRDEFAEILNRLFKDAPQELVVHNQLLGALVYNVHLMSQYSLRIQKKLGNADPAPAIELLPGYRNKELLAQVAKATMKGKDGADKKQGKRPLQPD